MNKQCDGWRKYGGAFSMGPPEWKQCTNEASVELKVIQDDKKSEMATCNLCWEEARNTPSIIIESARPVEAKQGKIMDEQLCERCGLYRRYQHPKTGKVYKLCANCGWEALVKLTKDHIGEDEDKKEEIKND